MLNGGDPHAGHAHHHQVITTNHARESLLACGEGLGRGRIKTLAPHPSPLHTPSLTLSPQGEEGRGSPGAAAAVLSVGIRPCSGALIVLVFALSQGIFWAGVASTFVHGARHAP